MRDINLQSGQTDDKIITTITTLSMGSTYILNSQSVSQIIKAEMTTITEPKAIE